MSKIANHGLTWSGIQDALELQHPYGNSGRQRVNYANTQILFVLQLERDPFAIAKLLVQVVAILFVDGVYVCRPEVVGTVPPSVPSVGTAARSARCVVNIATTLPVTVSTRVRHRPTSTHRAPRRQSEVIAGAATASAPSVWVVRFLPTAHDVHITRCTWQPSCHSANKT